MKIAIACFILAIAVVGKAEPPVNRYLPPGRSNDYQSSSGFRQLPSTSYGAPSEQYGVPKQTQALVRRPSQHHGAPRSRPSSQYGPPSQRISQSYGPPSAHSNNMLSRQYGAPTRQYGAPQRYSGIDAQQFGARSQQFGAPSQQYGAPSQHSAPSQRYGAPSQYSRAQDQSSGSALSSQYGVPSQQSDARSAIPQQYGAPQQYSSAPSQQYGAPSQLYGAPQQYSSAPSQQYGVPSQQYGKPSQQARVPSNQYLPASNAGYGRNADDESNNEPANYNFEYMVKDEGSGADFGHRESRQDDRAEGVYFVLLPDGRKQTVEYEADEEGFKPRISYEETGYARGAGGYDSNSQSYSGNSGYSSEPQGPY